MSTTTITMPSPVANGRTEKSSKKQSKIIVLPLPPSILKKFEPKKESPSNAPSPAPTVEEMPQLKKVASQDQPSETNSTPAPTQEVSTPGAANKKKTSSVTNGVKRSTPMPSDGMAKPRGKPGPKKKPRLEDGTIDHSVKAPVTGTTAHKLGPKANTGFINANLRALDRSGAPCRRWERKGFNLKSFTGHTWELASWKGLSNSVVANGHSEGSNNDVSMHGSSERKQSESDTAAGSHTGDHPDRMDITTPAASSPPPPVLIPQGVPIHT